MKVPEYVDYSFRRVKHYFTVLWTTDTGRGYLGLLDKTEIGQGLKLPLKVLIPIVSAGI